MSKINFEEQHFNLNVKLYFTECYVSAHPASKSILPSFSSTVNVSASAYDILTDTLLLTVPDVAGAFPVTTVGGKVSTNSFGKFCIYHKIY